MPGASHSSQTGSEDEEKKKKKKNLLTSNRHWVPESSGAALEERRRREKEKGPTATALLSCIGTRIDHPAPRRSVERREAGRTVTDRKRRKLRTRGSRDDPVVPVLQRRGEELHSVSLCLTQKKRIQQVLGAQPPG